MLLKDISIEYVTYKDIYQTNLGESRQIIRKILRHMAKNNPEAYNEVRQLNNFSLFIP